MADPLPRIDREIAAAEARLAVLREVRAWLVPAGRPEPAPRPSPAAPEAPPAAANGHGGPGGAPKPRVLSPREEVVLGYAPAPPPAGVREKQRRDLAVYIAREGPARPTQAMADLGIPKGSWGKIVDCPFFENEQDGYHLTAEGRSWLESLGPTRED